jgi:hypothetical protein
MGRDEHPVSAAGRPHVGGCWGHRSGKLMGVRVGLDGCVDSRRKENTWGVNGSREEIAGDLHDRRPQLREIAQDCQVDVVVGCRWGT